MERVEDDEDSAMSTVLRSPVISSLKEEPPPPLAHPQPIRPISQQEQLAIYSLYLSQLSESLRVEGSNIFQVN